MKIESQPMLPMMLALLKKISPMKGILDKIGNRYSFPKGNFDDYQVFVPIVIHALSRKTAKGGAIKFNTVPETIWSARK